jgi:MOSC domain-containing protein YiiM
MNIELDLLATNVGRPAYLGDWQGERIISAIRKQPLPGPLVKVSATNIAGDEQADLSVHGGVDKAVYAYPADHWDWWQAQNGLVAGPAAFGENLTITGADENHIRIGDRFSWGDVTLEVSQPRAPCYKFVMLTRREDMATRMTVSAHTGWYFRVTTPGEAPTRGKLMRTFTEEAGPTVREAFTALYHPRASADVVERALACSALARTWHAEIRERHRDAREAE